MRVIDLFAGCGGLSMGFENANFEVVAAYDNWRESCEVYAVNFKHPIFQKDLSDIQDTSVFKKWQPDMIIGGPPCQDFSSAGKRDETLGRADLTLTFAQIISDVRPAWFVMENVERIQKSKILHDALELFKASGYGISHTVLLASQCGVPQSRKRFFMVGHLESTDGFLDDYFSKNLTHKPMTVAEYMGENLDLTYYYRHPRSYARRGIYSVHEPSATIRGVNRPLPKTYQKHAGDPCEPSENVRPLTTLERSYLQTFPEGFKWLGSKTHQEQMIGNAVPVKLAEYVANCIAEYVADTKRGVAKKRRSEQQLELFAV
jgi:DNA (cytosine-5)-methyltransferase 1